MEVPAMKKVLIFLLLAVCVVGTAWAQIRANQYREDALRSDSIAAANDTARALALKSLSDSTNAWQLRIVQTELQRDSVEKELRDRPVVRVYAGLRVDTLKFTDTVQAPVMIDTVRVYAFAGTDGPFDFAGTGRIFPAGQGIFNVKVGMNRSIPVEARITCGQERGIKSASLLLTAEDPFDIVPESVVQDPEICNPNVPVFQFTRGKLFWAGGGLLAGVILANLWDDGFRKAYY
jgi:hypothetical protein